MPRAQKNSNIESDAKATRKKNDNPGPPNISGAQEHSTISHGKSASYPAWKWLPVFYVAWLAMTWLLAYVMATGLAPICSLPLPK